MYMCSTIAQNADFTGKCNKKKQTNKHLMRRRRYPAMLKATCYANIRTKKKSPLYTATAHNFMDIE